VKLVVLVGRRLLSLLLSSRARAIVDVVRARRGQRECSAVQPALRPAWPCVRRCRASSARALQLLVRPASSPPGPGRPRKAMCASARRTLAGRPTHARLVSSAHLPEQGGVPVCLPREWSERALFGRGRSRVRARVVFPG